MSDGSSYFNTDLTVVPKDLVVMMLSIPSTNAQGNAGTSLPCKKVWVQGALSNASYTMMNIGVAATSVLGMVLPNSGALGSSISIIVSTAGVSPPMEVEIDDVSKLHFWNPTANDMVNIMYRR